MMIFSATNAHRGIRIYTAIERMRCCLLPKVFALHCFAPVHDDDRINPAHKRCGTSAEVSIIARVEEWRRNLALPGKARQGKRSPHASRFSIGYCRKGEM